MQLCSAHQFGLTAVHAAPFCNRHGQQRDADNQACARGLLHITVLDKLVQYRAELSCIVLLLLHIQTHPSDFQFQVTGRFVAASKLGCYNMMLCSKLKKLPQRDQSTWK